MKNGLTDKEYNLLLCDYYKSEVDMINENDIRRSADGEVIVKIKNDDYAFVNAKANHIIPYLEGDEAMRMWDEINLYAK